MAEPDAESRLYEATTVLLRHASQKQLEFTGGNGIDRAPIVVDATMLTAFDLGWPWDYWKRHK